MYTFLYLFAFCIIASIVAIWVGISDRHGRVPRPSGPTKSWEKPSHLLHRSASGTAAKQSGRGVMLLAIVCFGLPSGLCAQEVIHAVSGTVGSINATGKTITLKLDDGSSRLFKQMPRTTPTMAFDKTLEAQSTAATELHQVGKHVILFFYGYDQLTTAVAFIDISQGASKAFTGSITQYDRHQHVLTVKGPAPQPQHITVNQKTVVDTADGAVNGLSYHPSRGRQILVVASTGSAVRIAIFVSPFE